MNSGHIFKFCHLEFLDTHAVVTCNEGVHIDFNEIKEIEETIKKAYPEIRFGIIANRENQYSVNPIAIDKLFSIENLIAGAIVGHSYNTKINAEFENSIVKGAPIHFFTDMYSATNWIKQMVDDEINK